jgi:hypothetical protein
VWYQGEDVRGDEEDDEERDKVDEPGPERGRGVVSRHGDSAGERGRGAAEAEEGQWVGRRVARAHRRVGSKLKLPACSVASPLESRLGWTGFGWVHLVGWCIVWNFYKSDVLENVFFIIGPKNYCAF